MKSSKAHLVRNSSYGIRDISEERNVEIWSQPVRHPTSIPVSQILPLASQRNEEANEEENLHLEQEPQPDCYASPVDFSHLVRQVLRHLRCPFVQST